MERVLHSNNMSNEPSNIIITEDLDMIWSLEDDWNEEMSSSRINNTTGMASAATTTTTTTKTNSKSRKNGSSSKLYNEEKEPAMEEESSSGGLKKLDHNEKERIRRMKLNASYLALRSLLPHSTKSKKKWSAPAIVDRALKYIPELANEVETLRRKKENVETQTEIAKKNSIHANANAKYNENPSISLNRVNGEEAIVQVCMAREEDESQFTNLVQSVEDEGFCIKSASALDVSHTRICYHLHIQTNNTASESEHDFEELRDKVISWLRT